LLKRYLRRSRGPLEADEAFDRFMSMVSRGLREMSDIMRNKTIKVAPEDWPQVQDII